MTEMMATRVAEGLAELKGTVMAFMKNWEVQDERANESRREIHKKLTDNQVAVGGLTRDLAEVVNDVAEMRPKVDKLESLYDRGWGAVWAIRLIGGAAFLVAGWLIAHFTPLTLHVR